MVAKKYLGIDHGAAKIGLSLSAGTLAMPYAVLEQPIDEYSQIAALVAQEQIDAIVVGVPVDAKGNDTETARHVREFIAKLCTYVSVPVVTTSERYTTAQAQRMNVGKTDDAHAASLLLQTYIDQHGND